jgi:uncharacterized membrane protein SirB2
VAEEERSGLSPFDGVLIVGGGLIALYVAFNLLGFIAGVVWFVIKAVVVIALIVFLARLLFRRR